MIAFDLIDSSLLQRARDLLPGALTCADKKLAARKRAREQRERIKADPALSLKYRRIKAESSKRRAAWRKQNGINRKRASRSLGRPRRRTFGITALFDLTPKQRKRLSHIHERMCELYIPGYNANVRSREYKREAWRYKNDISFRLKKNLRLRIRKALRVKGFSAATRKRTHVLLGISSFEFMRHIERMFAPGMSWDNYGKWHIDHVIPLASAKSCAEMEALCHYKNLQPLWALENISKGSRRDN